MDNLSKEEQRLLRAMSKKRAPKVASSVTPQQEDNLNKQINHPKTPQTVSTNTNTSSNNEPKPQTHVDNVKSKTSQKTIDEEEIRRRELEYEKERERLRKVEENLMKNRKSVLDDFDAELDLISKTTSSYQQQKQEQPPQQPITIPKEPETNQSSNKSLNDFDDLLSRLNSANIGKSKEQLDLDAAKALISKRRTDIFSTLSMAMASDPPSNPEEKLKDYMKGIIESVNPVSEMCKEISLANFSYGSFAKCVDQLIHTIAKDLHCIVDPSSQESIISHCADLLDKEVDLFNTIYNDILIGGEDKDQKVLSALNKFNLLLKRLMETLSNVSKHQILDYQYSKDKQAALAQLIQETAVYAQKIGEILKQPLFEPQTFKDNLTSMVESIKKVIELLPENKKEELMNKTKRILEKSLELQDSHTKPDIPNEVLNSIADVLKYLISNLDTTLS